MVHATPGGWGPREETWVLVRATQGGWGPLGGLADPLAVGGGVEESEPRLLGRDGWRLALGKVAALIEAGA